MNDKNLIFEIDFNLSAEKIKSVHAKYYCNLTERETGETLIFTEGSPKIIINQVVYEMNNLFNVEIDQNTYKISITPNSKFEAIFKRFEVLVTSIYTKESIHKSNNDIIYLTSEPITSSEFEYVLSQNIVNK